MHQIEPRRNPNLWGAILIGLGVLFLPGQMADFEFLRLNWGMVAWPLFPIIVGIALIVLGLVLEPKNQAMTIVGVILTVAGAVLWFQAATGAYQTWAYAWALVVPTSIGLGMRLHGEVTHQPLLVSRGITLTVVGLVMFGVGFTFFEYTVNLSGFDDSVVGRLLGPVLLIGLGVYALWRRSSYPVEEKPKNK